MLQRNIAHAISIFDETRPVAGHIAGLPGRCRTATKNPQSEGAVMEASVNVKSKAKPASSGFDSKFEMPKFDMPKMEVPAAFREIAEKSVSTAKENYEKLKVAAEEATNVLEETYATATKGSTEYGIKLIETARINTNAAFDFFSEIITVK